VSVQNLASFIANRLAADGKPFDVFLAADKEQVSTPEFINRLAQAMNKKARLFQLREGTGVASARNWSAANSRQPGWEPGS
jgi:hypothetical protein